MLKLKRPLQAGKKRDLSLHVQCSCLISIHEPAAMCVDISSMYNLITTVFPLDEFYGVLIVRILSPFKIIFVKSEHL